MTNTANAASTTAPDAAVTVAVEWADWDNKLPVTNSAAVLSAAVAEDLKELVAEGAYPAGTRLIRRISGGLIGNGHHALVELSLPDVNAAYDFFVAYCGGDREHALDELHACGYSL